MYVFCSSYHHNVAPRGKYIAFVSTTVETGNPEAELTPGLSLLGPIDQKFVDVVDYRAPLKDGTDDSCFISEGCADDERGRPPLPSVPSPSVPLRPRVRAPATDPLALPALSPLAATTRRRTSRR